MSLARLHPTRAPLCTLCTPIRNRYVFRTRLHPTRAPLCALCPHRPIRTAQPAFLCGRVWLKRLSVAGGAAAEGHFHARKVA